MGPSSDDAVAKDFADDDEFLRRIPPWLFDFEKQEIQSWAFSNDKDRDSFSVNWAELSSVEHTTQGHQGFGVASLTAHDFRIEEQVILHTRKPDNVAHCDVVGEKPKARQRKLRNMAMDKLLLQPERLDSS